jgi:hypothetical protein
MNWIGGVMLTCSPRVRLIMGSSPDLVKPKTMICMNRIVYDIGIWFFYAKHTKLRRKSKYWLARNRDNVSEWVYMSICGLLFQWASTKIPIKGNRCWYSTKRTSSSSHWKLTHSYHDIAEKLLTHSLKFHV